MEYYFLSSRLPTLTLDQPPEITWEEYLFLLENNLTRRDLYWVNVIRFYYDLHNLRQFWLEKPLDPRGNYTVADLEEAFLKEDVFPDYVYAFLERYPNQEDRLRNFSTLIAAYFRQYHMRAPCFLNDFLAFERQLRIVLVGFRAKMMQRDLALELQDEDPEDPLVAQLMAQKDAKTFEPPEGFDDLKGIFQKHADDPLDLYRALAEYRFRWIEERLQAEIFSIDRILGYTIQLIMVYQWLELDREKGLKLMKDVI